MDNRAKSTKDGWDKLEIIGKSLAGVLVSAAIAFFGFYYGNKEFQIAEENRQKAFKIAEQNRKAQIIVQTMGNREKSAADLKAKMFSTLMEHYLKEKENPVTQRIILELIGLNFQENLRLKPLFEKLESELKDNTEEIYKLRSAAKNMARIEIANIVGSGGQVCEVELDEGDSTDIGEECMVPITLSLLGIGDGSIEVSTDENVSFSVSYFDMPLVDNTTLGDYIYSVILSGIDLEQKRAKVKVVVLPEHFYCTSSGLRFDRMIGDWLVTDY